MKVADSFTSRVAERKHLLLLPTPKSMSTNVISVSTGASIPADSSHQPSVTLTYGPAALKRVIITVLPRTVRSVYIYASSLLTLYPFVLLPQRSPIRCPHISPDIPMGQVAGPCTRRDPSTHEVVEARSLRAMCSLRAM